MKGAVFVALKISDWDRANEEYGVSLTIVTSVDPKFGGNSYSLGKIIKRDDGYEFIVWCAQMGGRERLEDLRIPLPALKGKCLCDRQRAWLDLLRSIYYPQMADLLKQVGYRDGEIYSIDLSGAIDEPEFIGGAGNTFRGYRWTLPFDDVLIELDATDKRLHRIDKLEENTGDGSYKPISRTMSFFHGDRCYFKKHMVNKFCLCVTSSVTDARGCIDLSLSNKFQFVTLARVGVWQSHILADVIKAKACDDEIYRTGFNLLKAAIFKGSPVIDDPIPAGASVKFTLPGGVPFDGFAIEDDNE